MAHPVHSETQVTAAISLNQKMPGPRRKGIGERKPVRPGLAERVKSRRALLHPLYPVQPRVTDWRARVPLILVRNSA